MAKERGFNFGCKIVRGAYMDYERCRSEALGGVQCPVLGSYEETNRSYDAAVENVLENIRFGRTTLYFSTKVVKETRVAPSCKMVRYVQHFRILRNFNSRYKGCFLNTHNTTCQIW